MKSADSTQPPIISEHPKQRHNWLVWIVAVAVIVLAGVLFAFDPEDSSFYPTCMFKKATGYSCPACGCLRASHQLLNGHVATAFHLNALFIVVLPIAGLLALQNVFQKPIIKKPAYLGWAFLVLFVLFGFLRNLPPFSGWSGQ